MICHCCFFKHGFQFQDSVFNRCYDLTLLSVNINGIAFITIKNVGYCCVIHNISKTEAIILSYVVEDRGYIKQKLS